MKAKVYVTGVKELQAQFRHAAEKVPANARKIMHRRADKIVKEAKLNAPVDDAELEDSIRKEVEYDNNRRVKITIVGGGMVRGVDVSKYIATIHENYESFKPGANTQAKRASNPGRYIGSKFIKRAVDAERASLRERLIRMTVRTIKNPSEGEGDDE